VRSDVHAWVARLWTERQTKYTRATLETLALIAYRQPITRGEIEQIRGVAVNANMVKALEEREWIRVVGHRDVPGRPELFGTTKVFLDYFGLKSLDQLPPLAELKDIPDLEPQLPFDVDPAVVANAAMAMDEPLPSDDDAANDDADDSDDIPAGDDAGDNTHDEAGLDAEPELRND
jgi:segregation and condensation protein B